ncbi:pyruvate kinase [Pasteurella multocida subsp. multocida]|nr:pyruvate kinase [Pasteurella multocida subsp. multocida]
MIGYVIDDRGRDSLIGWYKNGLYASCGGDGLDIVGMYEEPRPTVTLTLPCPLKAVMAGQKVFYLDLDKQYEQVCSFLFRTDSTYHFNLLKNGGIFSTEEDAQAWFDAMRDTRR